jgi:PAS domain S-box-containing protein
MVSRFNEAIYQAMIANAPDGILLVDGQGLIVLVNNQLCELFGYARDELLGLSVEYLVPVDHRHGHVAQRESFQHQPRVRPMGIGQELTGRRRDGSEIPVEISLASVEGGDSPLAIAMVRDVTERREIEEERGDLIATVQRQLERDRIARDLHDDIIQSVYAVGLSLQASRTDNSVSRDDLVRRTVVDLSSVISDIRVYMRELTDGELDGNPSGMLGARIEELVAGGGPPHWTVNISLARDPGADLGRQVHRLTKELVSNVHRHAQAPNASITLIHDGALELIVEDDGIGFDPTNIRKGAFGLRSVQERVTELGGEVTIETHAGRTRIGVSIPVATRARMGQPLPGDR